MKLKNKMRERKKAELEMKDCTFKPNITKGAKGRKSKGPIPYPMDMKAYSEVTSQVENQTQTGTLDLNNSLGSMSMG